MRRGKAIGWTLLLGLVAWALVGRGLVNYDTLYALVWGRDLTHGKLPDYDVSLAPTAHPLATLAGAVLSVLGASGAIDATIVLAFVFLGALGWITYRLGEAWINPAAGALAAAIVLTRQPVLDFGARAYVDIPYLALVLGALLVETRRRRAGAPVLALLGLAGLIRPEAWLFSVAYLAWLWHGGVRDPRLWALAAAAPLLWALGDLAVTGDPLHSLTGTRDTAQRLQRITGLDDVPGTVPRRLGEILREPVLFGAAGGGLLALAFLRARVGLGAAAGVVALLAFCVLAAAGLPILGRYLLAPAVILAVFCGAGAFGWAELPHGHPWRRRWAWFGAATLIGLVAFIPAQANRVGDLRAALRIQDAIQDDLHALTPRLRCTPVTVPNHRPVPLLALWLDVDPERIAVAQEQRPRRGSYVVPSTARVARRYILDPRDVDPRIPPPPPGFRPVGANASWRAYARCA
ncbi:MAG TPA: hypothetical protein VFY32_08895 [Solirubrobacteraceae bacterium]|nr:hypothetical protein [Solirubrobacteraceae bacterium]